jgi:C4-dicarboxylate-specific signal transduction histidine kinase
MFTIGVSGVAAGAVSAIDFGDCALAHEINQPVAALMTNAQAAVHFLESSQPNLNEVRYALDRILGLGNRIVEVAGRTRALVQKAPPRRDKFHIDEAIREVISLYREELVKNAVSVTTRFAPGLPLLVADRVQVQQVISNLIANAMEAMSAVSVRARTLCIRTGRTTNSEILVAVQDSGPGVDGQKCDRMFDAFCGTKPGGLGMGLSICRSIIRAHDGRLWATSSKPHGARFQFTVPLPSSDSRDASARPHFCV